MSMKCWALWFFNKMWFNCKRISVFLKIRFDCDCISFDQIFPINVTQYIQIDVYVFKIIIQAFETVFFCDE